MAKIAQPGRGFGPTEVSGTAPTAPAAPTIVVTAGTDSLAVAISGASGATHTVLYKLASASAWTSGGSRTGDGVVTISSLAAGTYHVQAYSTLSDVHSTPGPVTVAVIAAAALAAATFPVTWVSDSSDPFTILEVDSAVAAINRLGSVEVQFIPADGSGARTIRALVSHQPPATTPPAPHGTAPQMTVSVLNSDTWGVAAASLDCGRDLVRVPPRQGAALATHGRRITQILRQDAGMLTLEVR